MSEISQKVDQLFARWDRVDSPGAALAVVRDGEIIYSRGYGMADLERSVPLSSRSVFDIASTSKQFTAMAVLLLAYEGRLSLDDDVRKFLPEMRDYGSPITICHLAHHTSGLRDYTELMARAGMGWDNHYEDDEILALLFRQKALNFRPGQEHLYSNSGYLLLGEIVRRVSGQTLGQFTRERILEPMGMTASRLYDDYTAVVPNRAIGYEPRPGGGYSLCVAHIDVVGDGGLLTSVEDLARWDRNFYDNRLGGGAELLAQMQTAGRLNNGEALTYAWGLEINSYRGLPVVSHAGAWAGYRAELLRFPQQRFSVICLANLVDVDCSRLAYQVADLYLAELLEPLSTSEAGTAATVVLSAAELETYVGAYRGVRSGQLFRARVQDGVLVIRHPAGIDMPLLPLGQGRFRAREDSPLAFTAVFAGAAPRRQCEIYAEKEPVLFVEVELVPPSAALLAEVAGEYGSRELGATYRLFTRDGGLWLQVGYAPAERLEPAGEEAWFIWRGTLCLRRDRAGQVRGIDLRGSRAKGIYLRRRKGQRSLRAGSSLEE